MDQYKSNDKSTKNYSEEGIRKVCQIIRGRFKQTLNLIC